MKKTMKAFISVSLALLMLFMFFFAMLSTHNHSREQMGEHINEHLRGHTTCFQCELLQNVNDFTLLFLFLCTILAIIPIIISLLAFILTKYRSIELSPIKLRDKLSN